MMVVISLNVLNFLSAYFLSICFLFLSAIGSWWQFSFYYELNEILFGSQSTGKLLPRSYCCKFERYRNRNLYTERRGGRRDRGTPPSLWSISSKKFSEKLPKKLFFKSVPSPFIFGVPLPPPPSIFFRVIYAPECLWTGRGQKPRGQKPQATKTQDF